LLQFTRAKKIFFSELLTIRVLFVKSMIVGIFQNHFTNMNLLLRSSLNKFVTLSFRDLKNIIFLHTWLSKIIVRFYWGKVADGSKKMTCFKTNL
jgi:hypothetical protein